MSTYDDLYVSKLAELTFDLPDLTKLSTFMHNPLVVLSRRPHMTRRQERSFLYRQRRRRYVSKAPERGYRIVQTTQQ